VSSPTALDTTQIDDLKILIQEYGNPSGVKIPMKETLMVVIDALVDDGKADQANELFVSPNDILRYLWYKKTGFLQIIEPKTIINRIAKNSQNRHQMMDHSTKVKIQSGKDLKLKFDRAQCRRYASWLNNLDMEIEAQCEIMHPKRNMWVRVIRALRLAEYSNRKGFEKLAKLLDVFYNEAYEVWQGNVNHYKLKVDADASFALLKQRPGLFARSLFSTMLWFGPDETIAQFKEIISKVPARLIYTLNMYADIYFEKNSSRTVKPLGGTSKRIPSNKLLNLYPDKELSRMKSMIQDLSLELIKQRLSEVDNPSNTMFIADQLFNIPISIGDRTETLQDLPAALMGTRFQIESDQVRLFMNWGEGLKAQHLDMDLSCKVAYDGKVEFCSYSQLVIKGCKHSGDIQRIPNKVGTAEYIEIDLNELSRLGAKYVSFTCNAYTNGSLSPNMVVGWMNSKFPMKITKNGVAYDPTAVQHQLRISQSISKGLVFGVLDVMKREVVWLEMSFGGQLVQNLDMKTVESLLAKLDAKLKIGDLLKLKAEMQGLNVISNSQLADEVYDNEWVLNTAEVSRLFLGE